MDQPLTSAQGSCGLQTDILQPPIQQMVCLSCALDFMPETQGTPWVKIAEAIGPASNLHPHTICLVGGQNLSLEAAAPFGGG